MYKISDFSKATDTSVQTLRYYDNIGLFKPSYCDYFSGYRYYQKEQIKDIKLINELKEIGLSLESIKTYLETSDIDIILKQRKDIEDKINKINEFINIQINNKKYLIKEYDYQKYIEVNGTKQSTCPQALELRDNNAKYFIIYENNEFYKDFCIYTEDNWITINRNELTNNVLMNEIISFLKSDYNYEHITTYIPVEEQNIIEHLNNTYDNIKVEKVYQGKWEYNKMKIYL